MGIENWPDDLCLDNQRSFPKTADILNELQRLKRIDRSMEIKVPRQKKNGNKYKLMILIAGSSSGWTSGRGYSYRNTDPRV